MSARTKNSHQECITSVSMSQGHDQLSHRDEKHGTQRRQVAFTKRKDLVKGLRQKMYAIKAEVQKSVYINQE